MGWVWRKGAERCEATEIAQALARPLPSTVMQRKRAWGSTRWQGAVW